MSIPKPSSKLDSQGDRPQSGTRLNECETDDVYFDDELPSYQRTLMIVFIKKIYLAAYREVIKSLTASNIFEPTETDIINTAYELLEETITESYLQILSHKLISQFQGSESELKRLETKLDTKIAFLIDHFRNKMTLQVFARICLSSK